MTLTRTERHIIKQRDTNLDDLMFKSKNLYNFVNYILRQVFYEKLELIPEYSDIVTDFKSVKSGKIYKTINQFSLITRLTKLNQIDFRELPSNTSQQIIFTLFKNWKSFYKGVLAYSKNPKKFKSLPKVPGYKDKPNGRNLLVFTTQQVKLKDGFVHFPKKVNISPVKTRVNNLKQVRLLPRFGYYVLEIVYNKEVKLKKLNTKKYLSLDLGVNNLLVTSDGQIVNGKIVKSINAYYNKTKARLQSLLPHKQFTSKKLERITFRRTNKISDYMHKTSKYIVDYCVENKVGNLVIGYNKGWKQNVQIGKKNNQNFVSIPYLKLVQMIQYKSEEVGLYVTLNEESYTSKVDALAKEPLKFSENYLGKRVKRGLFQSSTGRLLNADLNGALNGALNILRKVIGDGFIDLVDKSCVGQPRKVSFT